jgi:hypothetical protein
LDAYTEDAVWLKELARKLESRIHKSEPISVITSAVLRVAAHLSPAFNLPGQLQIVLDIVRAIVRINKVRPCYTPDRDR